MTIEIPDRAASPAELKLEVACQLYAKGKLGKITAAEMAGLDLFAFQSELHRREIPIYTEQMLQSDLKTISTLFQK